MGLYLNIGAPLNISPYINIYIDALFLQQYKFTSDEWQSGLFTKLDTGHALDTLHCYPNTGVSRHTFVWHIMKIKLILF